MPSGMPMTAQNSTEVTIIASVVMVCGQRPIKSMKINPAMVKMAIPRLANLSESRAKAAVVASIGTKANKASSPFSICVMGTCTALKNGRKLGTSQPRTKAVTHSSKGMTRKSDGLIARLLIVSWRGC